MKNPTLFCRARNAFVAVMLFAALAVPNPSAWAYGAIWYGDRADGYSWAGYVNNRSSASQAETDAQQECLNIGISNANCIITPVEAGHHAFARATESGSRQTIIVATGTSRADAADRVVTDCQAMQVQNIHCNELFSFSDSNTPISSGSSGDDSGDDNALLYVGGALVGVGIAAYFLSGDETASHNIKPLLRYSNDSGVWRYEAGFRQEWTAENFLAYNEVARIEDSGNAVFSYNSGMDYFVNPFKLSFGSSGKAEEVANKFSLAVNKKFGAWELSPNFAVNHQKIRAENLLEYSANLETRWRIRPDLTVSPAFNMRGQNIAKLGNNAEFNLSANWRF